MANDYQNKGRKATIVDVELEADSDYEDFEKANQRQRIVANEKAHGNYNAEEEDEPVSPNPERKVSASP